MKLFHVEIWSFSCIFISFVCKFQCVSELFLFLSKFLKKLNYFTNTHKLIHRNEQNTNKISYLDMEDFTTPHVLSL
jgi:hypothetical protein